LKNKTCCILSTDNKKILRNIENYKDIDFIVTEKGALLAIKEKLNIIACISDLDSVSESEKKIISKNIINLIILKTNKELTDGEECIIYAFKQKYSKIIFASFGNRMDHFLVQISMLYKYREKEIIIICNGTTAFLLKKGLNKIKSTKKYCSFICLEKDVITSQELKYPLNNFNINLESTNTISNELRENASNFDCFSKNGSTICLLSQDIIFY